MSQDTNDDGDDEYRPTDFLATCAMSYGIGAFEEHAMCEALRYAGPWDEDRDEPIGISVWELYADSWQSHSPTGPERGADWLSFTRHEVPVEAANDVSGHMTDAHVALGRALEDGETVEEQTPEEAEVSEA